MNNKYQNFTDEQIAARLREAGKKGDQETVKELLMEARSRKAKKLEQK